METPYYTRSLTTRLRKLVDSFPVVVVSGARQVGKSTLIAHTFKGTDIVVFDPLVDIENAKADPELFFNSHQTPLILDEIQYSPEIIPALKRRIDKNRSPGQYIITGSQQWQVMKVLAESLAGRAVFCDLDGFSLCETCDLALTVKKPLIPTLLQPSFTVKDIVQLPIKLTAVGQIWRGFLPEAQFLPEDVITDFHESYIRTYIERDVRLLGDVNDLHLFRRFFQLLSALTARELNYNQLGRDIGISPHTAKRWLSVFSSTFQCMEIPPFSGNAVKRISKRPKLHMADTGLVCHNLAISAPQAILGHPSWGAIFETAAVMEIVKQCRLLSPSPVMYHWHTHAGAEVDLVLEYNGKYTPIEVKSNSRPSKHDVRGIRAFRESYPKLPIGPGFILAPVERAFPITETDYVIPWNGQYL